jgi:hypothetical protein
VVQWLEVSSGVSWQVTRTISATVPSGGSKSSPDKQLRRGVFTNVPEHIEAMTTWGARWNDDPKPFICHATADDIIE